MTSTAAPPATANATDTDAVAGVYEACASHEWCPFAVLGVLLLVVLAACCCCCCCCCKRLRRQRRDDAEMTIVNTIVAHNVAVNPRLNSTDQKARRAQNVLSTTSAGYIDIVDSGDDAPELRGTPMEAIDPDLDVVKSTENLRHLNKARPKGPPKRRAPTRVGAAMRAQRSVTPTRRIVRPSIKILPVVEDSTTDASPDTTANPHRVAQAKARARARAKDVKKAASAASAASLALILTGSGGNDDDVDLDEIDDLPNAPPSKAPGSRADSFAGFGSSEPKEPAGPAGKLGNEASGQKSTPARAAVFEALSGFGGGDANGPAPATAPGQVRGRTATTTSLRGFDAEPAPSSVTATLHKGPSGFGVNINGPRSREQAEARGYGIVVTTITPGSPASRCHELKLGLQIVTVNGADVRKHTKPEFMQILKGFKGDTLRLVLKENGRAAAHYPPPQKKGRAAASPTAPTLELVQGKTSARDSLLSESIDLDLFTLTRQGGGGEAPAMAGRATQPRPMSGVDI